MENNPTLKDLCALESLLPTIPNNDSYIDAFGNVLTYIKEILINKAILKNLTIDDVIIHYHDNYKDLNKGILITELKNVYEDCCELLLLEDNTDPEYNEQTFIDNGFIKSEFVIHEHNSRKAPLHWDFRFKTEFKTSAYSFVILKHKMPENNSEKLLCKRQPMHPAVWVDLKGTSIESGYGAGSVTTIDRGTIYYKKKKESFSFYINGEKYSGAYHLIQVNNSNYLLFNATDSIIPTPQQKEEEWIQYMSNFTEYIKKQLLKKFNIKLNLIVDSKQIVDRNNDAIALTNPEDNSTFYIQTMQWCINAKNSGYINTMKSRQCNINSIGDIGRFMMLRNTIAPEFLNILKGKFGDKIIDEIYSEIKDKVDYEDEELLKLRNHPKLSYNYFFLVHVFSDIYMGHKYYGQFDVERYFINKISSKL